MLKLLLCTFSAFAIAVIMLQLRTERREIAFGSNELHDKIESYQSKLWNQQLQIAIYTAPNAITQTVGNHELNMVPARPTQVETSGWIDARSSTFAMNRRRDLSRP